jgi:hypothetical protein
MLETIGRLSRLSSVIFITGLSLDMSTVRRAETDADGAVNMLSLPQRVIYQSPALRFARHIST